MNALLFGAAGLLGRDIIAQRPEATRLVAYKRSELDVRDRAAVESAIRAARPEWVINASGYTNVDGAESDQETAYAVNATAVGDIARVCEEHGCRLLHYSTDYVFDGTKDGFYTEEDTPRPLGVYGASKLAGEDRVRASRAKYLIVRSQWLFGREGKSFVSTVGERARQGMPTKAATDQYGCVTYSVDLARVSWLMMGLGLDGTYHVANRGRVSRYDLAKRIFDAFDASNLLSRGKSSDFPAAARRPANSPLDVRKAEQALGQRMPEWTEALGRYLGAASVISAVRH